MRRRDCPPVRSPAGNACGHGWSPVRPGPGVLPDGEDRTWAGRRPGGL
jgi:hypothetical protein